MSAGMMFLCFLRQAQEPYVPAVSVVFVGNQLAAEFAEVS